MPPRFVYSKYLFYSKEKTDNSWFKQYQISFKRDYLIFVSPIRISKVKYMSENIIRELAVLCAIIHLLIMTSQTLVIQCAVKLNSMKLGPDVPGLASEFLNFGRVT